MPTIFGTFGTIHLKLLVFTYIITFIRQMLIELNFQGNTICSASTAEIAIPGDQAMTTGSTFCGTYLTTAGGAAVSKRSGTVRREFWLD
jgi:hypothetical protein